MKRILLCAMACSVLAGVSGASAADLPLKAPPAPIFVPPSWTGAYLGVNLGYSWGRSDTTATIANATTGAALATGASSFDMNGVVGGFQGGLNWQLDRWVLGIEADIQGSSQDGNVSFVCPGTVCNVGITAIPAASAPVGLAVTEKLQWFGTVRGRFGTTFFNPNWLLYATGGLAYGQVETNGTITGFNALGVGIRSGFSGTAIMTGWTVGAGLEGRLWGDWTGRVEYLYMDLGSVGTLGTNTLNFIPLNVAVNSKITDNIFRVGVNYLFR